MVGQGQPKVSPQTPGVGQLPVSLPGRTRMIDRVEMAEGLVEGLNEGLGEKLTLILDDCEPELDIDALEDMLEDELAETLALADMLGEGLALVIDPLMLGEVEADELILPDMLMLPEVESMAVGECAVLGLAEADMEEL